MKCNRCGRDIQKDDIYSHQGQSLCEDCYLDMRLEVKACDPWAVHSATRFRQSSGLRGREGLTDLQKAIYEFVKRNGRATREEVQESFGLTELEMQTQLATLRHCELLKGHKEDDRIYLVPFNGEE